MAKVYESLRSVSAYPIPDRTLADVSARRGISLSEEATRECLEGEAYNLALADILMWLAHAPDISQGGQSFSFTDEQRTRFRSRALAIYAEFGADTGANKPTYGYKGSRL